MVTSCHHGGSEISAHLDEFLGSSSWKVSLTDNPFVLQIADMHYGNGKTTDCSDVRRAEYPFCSDLNTTAFVRRLIQHEAPDLIVFTGLLTFPAGFNLSCGDK